jgi:uncharacterized protein
VSETLGQELLHEVRTRLVRLLNPEDILLFGSFAKGTATPQSDVDIFVIMPAGVHTEKGMVVQARRAIKDVLYARDLSFDILIKSSESFDRYKRYPGTIQYEAATHGISILDK